MPLNFDSLLEDIVCDLRLSLSTKEMENNMEHLKHNLQVCVLSDGTIAFKMKQYTPMFGKDDDPFKGGK